MSNLKIFLLSLAMLFILEQPVLAQEEVPPEEISPEAIEAVALDEDIQPEDLGVGEPRLLPDSPFYFLKSWTRAIRSFFAFNPIAKAELKERFANEKLMELKKMVKEKKDPEEVKKAAENYREEVEKIREEADKIKEKAKENPRVESFLDKFTHHQILHQRLLQRLEIQVPPEAFEKIKEARERHLETFGQVMTKLEDRMEKIRERLEKNLEEIEGSKYKNFKNLEVLKNLEEKMPEELKEKMKESQEKILKELHEDLEKMSSEDQERFKEYVEEISGNKLEHLEILGNLHGEELSEELEETIEKAEEKMVEEIEKWEIKAEKAKEQIERAEKEVAEAKETVKKLDPETYRAKGALKLLEVAKEHLAKAKEAFEEGKYGKAYGLAKASYHQALTVQRIAENIAEWEEFPEKLKEKFEELYPKIPLPEDIRKCKLVAPPRCPEGRITMDITPEGCPMFSCQPIPAPPEEVVCYMLWDPVCGVDGKTYSNDCVAEKIAKVEIAHKGMCKEIFFRSLEKIEKLEKKMKEKWGERLKEKLEEIEIMPEKEIEKFKELKELKEFEEILEMKPKWEEWEEIVCLQVITPAISPEGVCKEFRTTCDVPEGWKQVWKCPVEIPPTPPEEIP